MHCCNTCALYTCYMSMPAYRYRPAYSGILHSTLQSMAHLLLCLLPCSPPLMSACTYFHHASHLIHSASTSIAYPACCRWVDAHYEREAPKPERDIPRASASFARQSSYPEQRYAREEAHPSSRDHAPRLARELVPLARSYRDGQDARVDRDGHLLAPR